jgi:hypothetical protein
MMVDLLKDIEVIENALIAFSEGASDEKYAAFYSLEKLLLKKKDEFRQFEYDMEKEFANDSLKIAV